MKYTWLVAVTLLTLLFASSTRANEYDDETQVFALKVKLAIVRNYRQSHVPVACRDFVDCERKLGVRTPQGMSLMVHYNLTQSLLRWVVTVMHPMASGGLHQLLFSIQIPSQPCPQQVEDSV